MPSRSRPSRPRKPRSRPLWRWVRLVVCCLLCCSVTGCQVFEVLGAVVMMIGHGIVMLIQAILPVAMKLAPLLLLAGDVDGARVMQFDPNEQLTPEERITRICEFLEQNKDSIVAADIQTVDVRTWREDARRGVQGHTVPGLTTTAIYLPCAEGQSPDQMVRRLNRQLAQHGIRLQLYSIQGQRVIVATGDTGSTH